MVLQVLEVLEVPRPEVEVPQPEVQVPQPEVQMPQLGVEVLELEVDVEVLVGTMAAKALLWRHFSCCWWCRR